MPFGYFYKNKLLGTFSDVSTADPRSSSGLNSSFSVSSLVFTARCYASAVLAMGLYLSVCPSQVGVLSKRMNESSWFLARELPSTRPTLC